MLELLDDGQSQIRLPVTHDAMLIRCTPAALRRVRFGAQPVSSF
jgi:hypothetical protein